MLDNLYLILYAIAALGVIGLILVFFSFDRRANKKTPLLAAEIEVEEKEETATGKIISEETEDKHFIGNNKENLELTTFGFDAVDVLLNAEKLSATHTIYHHVTQDSDLIILYVMAPSGCQFVGYELLQALLAVNLHYGEMNIFHRYVNPNDKIILFSVSSAVEPGFFDLANMGAYACEGLSLFMSIAQNENPIFAFDQMLATAQQLSDDLGGELLDAKHELLTEVMIEEYQARVRP